MQSKIKYDTATLKTILTTLDEILKQTDIDYFLSEQCRIPMENRSFYSNLIAHDLFQLYRLTPKQILNETYGKCLKISFIRRTIFDELEATRKLVDYVYQGNTGIYPVWYDRSILALYGSSYVNKLLSLIRKMNEHFPNYYWYRDQILTPPKLTVKKIDIEMHYN